MQRERVEAWKRFSRFHRGKAAVLRKKKKEHRRELEWEVADTSSHPEKKRTNGRGACMGNDDMT